VNRGGDANYLRDALAKAERRHFWFLNRAALLAWAMRRYSPQAQSILEVGCGTGGVTDALRQAFPDATIVAGDADPGGIDYARRRVRRAHFLQLDICRLPLRVDFDVAGAFDVIEHLDDDSGALEAMRDAVKPGGGVFITVPQHPSLWSESDDYAHHRRRYTRQELRMKIEAAGLQVVRLTSFASVVPPLRMLARLIPHRAYDPELELRIAAVPNAILSAVSAIERHVIAAGVSLPAGGSLLAIAKRPQ
jgi:SAM-dependent methyltransferase